MKMSQTGVALLIEFEGFRADAYIPVPGDVPTIGIGFTKGVKMGDKMTLAQAKDRLQVELVEYEQGVLSACMVPPSQPQFDAMVCFAFNVGVAGFRKSSVLKAHNRGDFNAAARAFSLWNKSGGRVYPGLTRRRAAEAALYLTDTQATALDPGHVMPQAIDAERPMTASTINRASVVAGGTATVAAVSETIQTINGVKYGIEGLGDWLVPVLLIAVVGLCGYVIWERTRARSQGWM